MRLFRHVLMILTVLGLMAYPVGAVGHVHAGTMTAQAPHHDHVAATPNHHAHHHAKTQKPCPGQYDAKCCGMACGGSGPALAALETASSLERTARVDAMRIHAGDPRRDGTFPNLLQRPPIAA